MKKFLLVVIIAVFFVSAPPAFAIDPEWSGVWGSSSGFIQIQREGTGWMIPYFKSGECGGSNLLLKPTAPTQLVGTQNAYGGCRLTFNYKGQHIEAEMTGKGCYANCTGATESTTVVIAKIYPLLHRELNKNYDFARCESSKAWRAWCQSDEIQKLDKDFEELHSKVDDLNGKNTATEGENQRDETVRNCDLASNTISCLQLGYAKLSAELNSKSRTASKAADKRNATISDSAAIDEKDFGNWAGSWVYSKMGEETPGDTYEGDLEVTACTAKGCHYKVLSGGRISTCSSEGDFKFSIAGAFDIVRFEGHDDICRLDLTKKGDVISIDPSGHCNFLCGVSGGGPVGEFAKKRASFDCNPKKISVVEKQICVSDELGKADVTLAEVFRQKKIHSKGADLQALLSSQKVWLAERNKKCGAAKKMTTCLRESYESRLQALAK